MSLVRSSNEHRIRGEVMFMVTRDSLRGRDRYKYQSPSPETPEKFSNYDKVIYHYIPRFANDDVWCIPSCRSLPGDGVCTRSVPGCPSSVGRPEGGHESIASTSNDTRQTLRPPLCLQLERNRVLGSFASFEESSP